jgi:hypothetical protein
MQMKIEPVGQYREPGYPDAGEFCRKSGMESFIPERWKREAFAMGTMLALMFGGCTAAFAETQIPANPGLLAEKSGNEIPTQSNAAIAPIFEHGYGFVRSGGEAASHPKFLTENEARQIIEEEFKKAGVTFDRHDVKLSGAAGDYTGAKKVSLQELELTNYNGPVELDGYSTKNRFAYEFVSSADSKQFLQNSSQMMSTAPPVAYTKPAAQILNALLARSAKVNVITFYDPLAMKGCYGDLAISRTELKAQIRDAIAWAKSKGWIK